MKDSMRPGQALDDPVLPYQANHPNSGNDAEYKHEGFSSETSSEVITQAGVKRIEAVSKAWTKTSLVIAYVS